MRYLLVALMFLAALVAIGTPGIVEAGSFFSITVKTINLRPASVTEAGATLSESGTLVDVSRTQQGNLSDLVTISETATRSDVRRPTRTDTGAIVSEANTLTRVAGSPTPSPGPSSFFTPSAPHAPQLALNPNPFTVKACTDPCTHPPYDANSGPWISAYFPSGLQWERLQYQSPGASSNESTSAGPETVVLDQLTNAGALAPSRSCPGCDFATLNMVNGAYSAFSAGDWQISVVNNTAVGDTPNYATDFTTIFTSQGNPLTSGQAASATYAGGCHANAFAGGGNTCTMGTAGFMPFTNSLLDPVEVLQQNIPHMIQMLNQCDSSGSVLPAKSSDGNCGSGPPQGEILWLDWTDAQIDASTVPRWAKTLYHSMHRYGWLSANTSGDPLVRIQAVADPSWTINGRWPSQWAILLNEMTAEGTSVSNNGSNIDVGIPVPAGMTTANLHWTKLTFSGGIWHF